MNIRVKRPIVDSLLQRIQKNSKRKGCLVLFLSIWALFIIGTFAYADKIVFSIQIGAYKEIHHASDEMGKLKEAGHHVFYRLESAGKKGNLYRVYVAKYRSKQGAETAAKQLKQQGLIKDYIIRAIKDGKAATSPLVIKQITLNQNKGDTETLQIYSNRFFWPSVLFALEEAGPRLVILIPNATAFEKNQSKTTFKGDLIKAIRNPPQKKGHDVELILDLASDRKYEVTQGFDKKENVFNLIVRIKKSQHR